MNKNIKRLMLFNFLFYLNNFIVIILANVYGLKDIAALWFFSPFILILFTTSVIEMSKKKLIGLTKKMAILDFVLRCIVLIINFLSISRLIPFSFQNIIVFGLIFMALNIVIEWVLHKQLVPLKHADEDLLTKKEINELLERSDLKFKSLAEKEVINNSYRSIFFAGYSYVLIFLLIGGGIFAFEFFSKEYRHIVLLIAVVLLGIYFYLTNEKFIAFYKNEKKRQRLIFRDNITFIIGLSMIYILQGYIHIGTGTFNFLGIFLAVLFFYPTLKTNQQIRQEFHKINKKYLSKRV
ncbi:hypothetical protein [Bacillus sp. FJAT-50079]|uniref:hypothetical protein n=1 Tax=Bacillus sp. FJAT-50079 TaxID=2833577 RepID=UPI001BC8EE19|nr:hypothetical protein [Bacillus sp. FJAT-50079]MBS4207306.1 hypothetical protein [Bacillus sp. FJAT-50079]